MIDNAILRVDDLGKRFSLHARAAEIVAVEHCSFSVTTGSITALVGPSGAGKSTILKCVYRSYLPTAGAIRLQTATGEVDLARAADHEVLAVRARALGFVTQFLHCLPRKSALDVVAEPLVHQQVGRDRARRRAAELLAHLDIPERLWGLAPATFSGGEQQRINLARGFARSNRLLLLDEPTASLDAATAERVVQLIARARSEGTAILMICHDAALVDRLADHVVRLAPVGQPQPELSTP